MAPQQVARSHSYGLAVGRVMFGRFLCCGLAYDSGLGREVPARLDLLKRALYFRG
ncbi:hypothetical protein OG828_05510 [Streptomyces sp. NBC_00457]|uniref:hypothetical protein n=1 Tax=unclassified Streptomyces TaxID=2593676 RepID=UPI002E20021E|nr:MULTISPECIES: hypothetical protein [unclassified Streptomyces]